MGLPLDPVDVATGRARRRWQAVPLRWRRRAAVVAGGMLGGAARIGLSAVLNDDLPWGTFAANLTGAVLLGYLLTRVLQAGGSSTLTVPLLATGVLGSYTTFSTFSLEVWQLLGERRTATALAYAGASLALGVVAAAVGIRLAERRA